jgi:branched-chain amino acid transport system ATP-binding protein
MGSSQRDPTVEYPSVTTVLEVAEATRRFGGLVAINAIDMSVKQGEIRGLIGPNGAGKTTLLNVIGGQLFPSSGRIIFDGSEVGRLRADRRAALGIRRTFQNLKLFRDMTVLENVMVGLHTKTRTEVVQAVLRTPLQRREEAWMAQQARQTLALVGLSDYESQPAAALPYGHRRLLEIARAIVSKPRLLLLDEPAAGLNRTEAGELVHLIQRINVEGITIILVEHHMDVVMTACVTITVLNHGRLLAEGSPEQIRDHPEVIDAYLGRGDIDERIFGNA